MMTLADASSFFDRTPVLDADTGAQLFLGQIAAFDDSKRDSTTAYRRILSVAPGTSVPSAVSVFGKVYLVGVGETDGLESELRDKYVLHPADDLADIHSLSGFLSASVASSSWAAAAWVKDGKEQDFSDAALQTYDLFLPTDAAVSEHSVISLAGRDYIVHAVRPSPGGFTKVGAYLLEYAAAQAQIVQRVYSPAAGTYATSTSTAPGSLRVRWQFLYRYDSQEDARFAAGDAAIALPAGTAITTADRLTLSGETWKVLSVDSISGAVVVHGRPA